MTTVSITIATTTTVPPTTTTTLSPARQTAADAIPIRHMFEYVNTSYRLNVQQGHIADAASNYNTPTAAEKELFRKCFDNKLADVSYDYVVNSFLPSPGWVNQGPTNKVPKGRIYVVTVAITSTLVSTGVSRVDNTTMHVTVLPNGTAEDFLTCDA